MFENSWAFLKGAFGISSKDQLHAAHLPAGFRFCPNCGEYNSTGRYAGPGRNCWSCSVVLGSVNRHARPICPCCRAQNTNAANGFVCESCGADFRIDNGGGDLASIIRECVARLPEEFRFNADHIGVKLFDADGIEYADNAEASDFATVINMTDIFMRELAVIFRENRRWLPSDARCVLLGEDEVVGHVNDFTHRWQANHWTRVCSDGQSGTASRNVGR
jgi:hypothetical protein